MKRQLGINLVIADEAAGATRSSRDDIAQTF